MPDLGPHLLGRIPSPPDKRDWRLAHFLASDPSLRDQAVAELKLTSLGYRNSSWKTPPASSHWAKALALLGRIGATPPPPPTGDVVWVDPQPVLDQGNYGTCVGNGWAQWGNTLPVNDRFTEKDARAIYYETTIIDGSPDDPDAPGGGQQGASVRSGAKAMKNRGRLSAYAFAASIDEARAYLRAHGPVVFGSDWTSDMFSPDSKGFIKPTGPVEGGHCFLAVADRPSEDAIEFLNSWGTGWGLAGHFKIKIADLKTLFVGQGQPGEALAALELP